MRRKTNNIVRLSILSLIVFGIFVLYFRPVGQNRRHVPLVEYIQQSGNADYIQYAIIHQRNALADELKEVSQKVGEEYSDLFTFLLKQQRDLISQNLNDMRQRLGRLDCEIATNRSTNEVGGWCRNSSMENGGEHMTDMKLVQTLSKFFRGKTVGSFGDGPGAYKREIEKLGQVRLYDAYDGAPYCEETSAGRVKFLDLTVPQYGIPIYDWIISLEVAEHIPKEFEEIYIDNLVRHSREGIVMSWATPGQNGLAHVNNRPIDYAVKLMQKHGFSHNIHESMRLRLGSAFPWFTMNINVYYRKETNYVNKVESWFT